LYVRIHYLYVGATLILVWSQCK